jgi:hypothetical protein
MAAAQDKGAIFMTGAGFLALSAWLWLFVKPVGATTHRGGNSIEQSKYANTR